MKLSDVEKEFNYGDEYLPDPNKWVSVMQIGFTDDMAGEPVLIVHRSSDGEPSDYHRHGWISHGDGFGPFVWCDLQDSFRKLPIHGDNVFLPLD